MYTKEQLEEVAAQEERFLFDSFTNEDAVELASVITDMARREQAAVCCRISLKNFPVASGFLTGTGRENVIFLDRKENTVEKSGKSSLRCGMEAELLGLTEPWQEDKERYVLRGGGFPLRLKDSRLLGSVCVSGLQHQEDHRLLVQALEEFCLRKGLAGQSFSGKQTVGEPNQ